MSCSDVEKLWLLQKESVRKGVKVFPLLADKEDTHCLALQHRPMWGCCDKGEQENVMLWWVV